MDRKIAEVLKELEYYRKNYRCIKCMNSKYIDAIYNKTKNYILIYCKKCEELVKNIDISSLKEVTSNEEKERRHEKVN